MFILYLFSVQKILYFFRFIHSQSNTYSFVFCKFLAPFEIPQFFLHSFRYTSQILNVFHLYYINFFLFTIIESSFLIVGKHIDFVCKLSHAIIKINVDVQFAFHTHIGEL
jgi:hypothetical protein